MAFDINNPADLLALKTEVNTDPNAYGYIPEATHDGVLDIINLKRAEITVSKPRISPTAIKDDTFFEAYSGLLADPQEWLRWITEGGDAGDTLLVTQDLRDRLTGLTGGSLTGDSVWAVGERTEMEAAMLSLIDVDGSRAEELFGYGTSISRNYWFAARDS